MDNPEDLVRTLEGQVERLKVIFNEATSALTDDVSEVSQFCVSLECILRHHQKEKVSFWGDRRDYWNYLSEGVGRMKSLESIVKQVQTLPHLTTGQGRGRALIRRSLEEHTLADLIQNSISNSKRTREWYHTSSVVLSPSHSQRVIIALYDLSEVDFDLPSEGVELDETWPSFVLKSFQSSDTHHTLFGTFSPSTKEATPTSKKSPKQRRALLERGVEEEASEIYVKQEIPFSIELVGSLLDDIRCNLVGQSETIGGQTHLCPDLEVVKLDDITSCLTVLRDYITTWSRDITKNSHVLQEEVRKAKVRLADVELQLDETVKESEGVESGLLNQLQDTRDELHTCSNQIQELIDDNHSLKSHLSDTRSKISELEALNFSLEEQLMEAQEEEKEEEEEEVEEKEEEEEEEVDGEGRGVSGKRKRAFTLMEAGLQERDQTIQQLSTELHQKEQQLLSMRAELMTTKQALHQLSPLTSLLQCQVVAEAEAKAALYLSNQNQQDRYSDLERCYQQCVSETERLRGSGQTERELQAECDELRSKNQQLNSALGELRLQTREEVDRVKRSELDRCKTLEREVERLAGLQSVVQDEASSLKYQLSSTSMEVQQMKELVSEKDGAITGLRSKLAKQEQQLKETEERHRLAEDQVAELRRELQDVESVLQSNQDEMSSLNEQLTEVTLWQHADELEQEQLQMGTWIDSKTISECMECASPFTVFTRKHHCRSCGKVFCSKCCDKKIQLPFSKEPVRVCTKCHQRIDQMRTPFVSKLINSEMESLDTPPSLRRSSSGPEVSSGPELSSNSLNIERSADTAGNSLHAKLRLQNAEDDSSVASSYGERWKNINGSATIDGESTMSLEGSDTFETAPTSILRPPAGGRGSSGSFRSPAEEYSVEPRAKRRELEKGSSADQDGKDVSYHISAVEGDSLGDSYYLIETNPQFPVGVDVPGNRFLDVNALASKLASLEVTRQGEGGAEGGATTSLPGASGLTPGKNSQGAESASSTEIMLGGGQAHMVPVHVEKKGTVVAWEFSSEPKGLAFGLSLQEDTAGSKEEQVLPLRRCVSHKAVLTGEYVAQKAGSYILHFDNCHSKYSGRKLVYKIWKKPPL